MKEKNIQITGISETHWSSETEELFQHNGFAVFHSGRSDGVKTQGVAFVVESELADSGAD